MKAEHRKELETNVLADKMGRALEGLKHKPQRGTVFFVILGLAVALGAYFTVQNYRMGRADNSNAWFYTYHFFDILDVDPQQAGRELKEIDATHEDKIQGRIARMQVTSRQAWNAILRMGQDPKAREALRRCSQDYEKLKEDFADDPVLVPETMYSIAVIEETLSLDDRQHLDRAIELYEALTKHKEYKSSAYGKLAEQRLEILNDETRRTEVARVYQDLAAMMRFDLKK